ncbi:CBASS cGAMP-activated phospholipase [Caldalkalibacillus salinus]|uniref:CBASS cGAMP-activated phospholipase n=1 Tax=Caldalkalibacillus salinus TaxID=2803787 RepID=UPI001923E6EF|nr:CBASS cGAMP-activated phospholipase [Caldalkalibacillus salinus]
MKILALDGGGIRGIFTAYVLQLIEEKTGSHIGHYFDMIGGTSTGSIIAAAIVKGKPMREVVKFYEREGKKIFHRQAVFGFFQTIYSHKRLKRLLHRELGTTRLEQISQSLVLPAVDLKRCQPIVFRSRGNNVSEDMYHYHTGSNIDATLLDAVISSCSAPIYFEPYRINQNFIATDGGLWANNPSLVCLQEAIQTFNQKLDDIKIMSVGSGLQGITFDKKTKRWGLPHWIKVKLFPLQIRPTLIDLALHLSSESVSSQCQTLCGAHYLRLNAPMQHEVPFDDVQSLEKLKKLGEEVFVHHEKNIEQWLQY